MRLRRLTAIVFIWLILSPEERSLRVLEVEAVDVNRLNMNSGRRYYY